MSLVGRLEMVTYRDVMLPAGMFRDAQVFHDTMFLIGILREEFFRYVLLLEAKFRSGIIHELIIS